MKNIIAEKFCPICKKPIRLTYYPWNYCEDFKDDISREIDLLMERHQLNLCNSCKFEFATCKAKSIIWGECLGNDNVIECNKYKEDQ